MAHGPLVPISDVACWKSSKEIKEKGKERQVSVTVHTSNKCLGGWVVSSPDFALGGSGFKFRFRVVQLMTTVVHCTEPFIITLPLSQYDLTLLLLNTTCPVLANSVDPDQLASEEANWSGSALFVMKYVNFYQKPGSSNLIGWKLEVGVAS